MDYKPDRSFTKELKRCNKCGEFKDTSQFYRRKARRNGKGIMSCCKKCSIAYSGVWATKNREKVNAHVRKWRLKFPEREKVACARWKNANPDRVKFHARKTMAKIRSTVSGKLNSNISCMIYQSLRASKGGRHWETLVGFTLEQLKKHLEQKFAPGMTWENYGKVWEIDHKIPISVFNFESPEHIDFYRCWSLENLQPLRCEENLKKRAKISTPFQPSLMIERV